ANATLFSSPDPDFGVSFNTTPAQIVSAIETAGWTRDLEGSFALPVDLPLLNVTVTSLNPDIFGERAVIGTLADDSAFAARIAIPEPSSLTLFSISGLSIVAYTRRRRRRNSVRPPT